MSTLASQPIETADASASELKITGATHGPNLVVTLASRQSVDVVERLSKLPSLAYLRGVLVVGTDPNPSDLTEIDSVLDLRTQTDPVEIFWTLLARATALGMIAGRGIPARYLVDTAAADLDLVA